MRLPLAALALFGLASPAAGGDYQTWFAGRPGGVACYARAYDAAHLAGHPRQKVVEIELDFNAAEADSEGNRPSRFIAGLGVRLKGKKGWYTNSLYCNERAMGGVACSLESDGGAFTLQPAGEGLEMRLDREISIEGDDFIEFGGEGSDDNTFILKPAPQSVCDASTAEFR